MSHAKKAYLALFAATAFLAVPLATNALSGANANTVKVKIYAKQGGEWFRVLTKDTDSKGVLKFKNALPGWYRMDIDEDDQTSGQALAVEIRMTDRDGKRLKEKTDVDLSYNSSGTEVAIGTVQTDEDGWLKTEGLLSGVEYKMNISTKDSSHVSKKDNTVRIKTKTKIDTSHGYTDWFPSLYQRTEKDQYLVYEAENVLPGKYKFKYKTGDADPSQPFTLKIRLRDEDGYKIKKKTDVELYAYINKVRVLVGQLETDAKGWVTIPGVLTNMKYKIKI